MSCKPFWRFRPTDEEYLLERRQINQAKSAYDTAKQVYGPMSSEAVDALFELSTRYHFYGHYETAEWLMDRIWPFAPYVYPEDDIRSSDMLVRCAFRSQEVEKALRLGKEALERASLISGVDSIDAGYSMHNLGTLYSNHSRREEAVKWQLSGIDCLRKQLPDNDPELLSMVCWTARRCSMFEEYDIALPLQEELWQISLRDHGADSIEALKATITVARTSDLLGQHNRALLLWRGCYEAMREMQNVDKSDLITVMNGFCDCCISLSAHEKALLVAQKLLEVVVSGGQNMHLTLQKLGNIHMQLGDYEPAERYLRAAVDEMSSHKNVIFLSENAIKKQLASVYRLLGREQEANDVEATISGKADFLADLPGFPFEMQDDGMGGLRRRVTAIEPACIRYRCKCPGA